MGAGSADIIPGIRSSTGILWNICGFRFHLHVAFLILKHRFVCVYKCENEKQIKRKKY